MSAPAKKDLFDRLVHRLGKLGRKLTGSLPRSRDDRIQALFHILRCTQPKMVAAARLGIAPDHLFHLFGLILGKDCPAIFELGQHLCTVLLELRQFLQRLRAKTRNDLSFVLGVQNFISTIEASPPISKIFAERYLNLV